MCKFARIILILMTVVASGAHAFQNSGEQPLNWRTAVRCGPNSLYMFLKCIGWDGALGELYENVPVTKRGCSFAQLEEECLRQGVQCAIYKTDLDGLKRARMPVITHHENDWQHDIGHFYLLTNADCSIRGERCVCVIDPISLSEREMPVEEFTRSWTSYALIQKEARVSKLGLIYPFIAFAACVGVWQFAIPLLRR